jgi:hypothetical protein
MKHTIELALGSVMLTPAFIKIGSGIHNVMGRGESTYGLQIIFYFYF